MTRRPPHLSPLRVLAGLVVPLVAYLTIRARTGSSVAALAITDAVPSAWLLAVGIVRRRVDPIALLTALTVTVALAAYVLSGGDPLAIKLRRGAVTGTIGIVGLASVALGRPLLLLVAENARRRLVISATRRSLAARCRTDTRPARRPGPELTGGSISSRFVAYTAQI